MLIHAAKAHGNIPVKKTFSRAEHSTQSMPACRFCFCLMKFTRWARLRDHIEQQRCHEMDYQGVTKAPPSLDEGPPRTAEPDVFPQVNFATASDHNQQDTQTNGSERFRVTAPVSLVVEDVRPAEQSRELHDTLKHAMPGNNINEIYHLAAGLRKRLRQECAMCGQWIASHKFVKQHYMHSHKQICNKHKDQDQISTLCRKYSTLGKPCFLCASEVHNKTYTQQCTVLFQHCILFCLRSSSGKDGSGPDQRPVWIPAPIPRPTQQQLRFPRQESHQGTASRFSPTSSTK